MEYRLRSRLERFDRLGLQVRETMVVAALHELGVFQALRGGPASAQQLAERCGAGSRRMRQFLDAAARSGFVAKDGDAYALVPGDEILFDPRGPYLARLGLGGWDRSFATFARAREVLRADRSIESAGSGGAVSAEERRAFLLHLHARSIGVAKEVARILAKEPFERVADLGSGAGTYAFELLKENPRARATLVDRENAMPVIEECARSEGVTRERLDLRAVDMFDGDYGAELDLVVLSNIVHVFGPERNLALLRSIAPRVRSGGRIAIKDLSVDDRRTGPETGVYFGVTLAMFADDGDVYSDATVAGWLEQSGFVHDITYALREAPESYLLVARRA